MSWQKQLDENEYFGSQFQEMVHLRGGSHGSERRGEAAGSCSHFVCSQGTENDGVLVASLLSS